MAGSRRTNSLHVSLAASAPGLAEKTPAARLSISYVEATGGPCILYRSHDEDFARRVGISESDWQLAVKHLVATSISSRCRKREKRTAGDRVEFESGYRREKVTQAAN